LRKVRPENSGFEQKVRSENGGFRQKVRPEKSNTARFLKIPHNLAPSFFFLTKVVQKTCEISRKSFQKRVQGL
jgi:hypothetical protein